MKLQFDSSQDYQLAAMQAVTGVFAGQPRQEAGFGTSGQPGAALSYSERGVGNTLALAEEQLLRNVRAVQERFGLAPASELVPTAYARDGKRDEIRLNLTVEMETGTGKTYTYLRTIYELNKQYGWRKFIIVVPGVAIREGTLHSLRATHEHFQALYGQVPINFSEYTSSRLGALRNYATSEVLQVLVLTIDAFTKDSNIINTKRESGLKPIEYIQQVRPIVVVDEPQNMETDGRRAALANLNPLFLLRYSATHRHLYNLVYSLNPVQAYDRGLVKQILVDGITGDPDYNAAYVELLAIVPGKKALGAKLAFFTSGPNGVRKVAQLVRPGQDLFDLSAGRAAYRSGFVLESIQAAAGRVEFSGGQVLRVGEARGGQTQNVMKFQIEQTVGHHFRRLKQLQPLGIKVLSLFFIDRVANYRSTDAAGRPAPGKLGQWLEDAFRRWAATPGYEDLVPYEASQVHAGYFSGDKKGLKDTTGATQADDATYALIMRDKERLLNRAEPVQFIFSHSALREGWDNPNVFQICTLSEAKSTLRKRQEIGRGLRLPVDAAGRRVTDQRLNVLTVVANESYESFAGALQQEIEDETSVSFAGRIQDYRQTTTVRRTKELTPENYPLFFEIWDRISPRTRYRVSYDSEELVRLAVAELRDTQRVPPVARPRLVSEVARLAMSAQAGVTATRAGAAAPAAAATSYPIPDVYAHIQQRLALTRRTIHKILTGSGRLAELAVNPQLFLANAVGVMQRTLNQLLVAGIEYELSGEAPYPVQQLFPPEELAVALDHLFAVREQPAKTLYDFVPVASAAERAFARDLEASAAVQFFFKLPRGFRVPTPVGDYVPDWAVVLAGDRRVYFVAETQETLAEPARRDVETLKIECGRRHFALFAAAGVQYKVVPNVRDLVDAAKPLAKAQMEI